MNDVGTSDVWVYDVQRDTMTRLTFVRGNYFSPVWSPDGQYVVFSNLPNGISWTRADGAGQPAVLTQQKSATMIPWSFAPDGKRLAYFEPVGGSAQIWDRLAGEPERTVESRDASAISRRLQPVVLARRPMAGVPLERIGQKRGVRPRVSTPCIRARRQVANLEQRRYRAALVTARTGHELVYRSGDQILAAGYAVNGETLVAEKPRVLIAKSGMGASAHSDAWDLAPDGKRVAVVIPVEGVEAPRPDHEVVFVQNFFDELRRRVPLGK